MKKKEFLIAGRLCSLPNIALQPEEQLKEWRLPFLL